MYYLVTTTWRGRMRNGVPRDFFLREKYETFVGACARCADIASTLPEWADVSICEVTA